MAVREGPFVGQSAIGGPFNPVNRDGKNVTENDLIRKHTVMYFDFTHCPDICPDELQKLDAVVDKISSSQKVTILCADISFGKEFVLVACVVDAELSNGCSKPWERFTYITKPMTDQSLDLDDEGWAVRVGEPILRGTFVCELIGELNGDFTFSKPNLVNYQVLVDSMDSQHAHIGLYAIRDEMKGCFLKLPVSCVERFMWQHQNAIF
ncbi:hypothetical protein ACFE04_021747 [Oxalis oulophora]